MTQSGRPGHVGPFRALGVVLGGAAAVALVSAAACLADLPAYDADAGPGGQDGGGGDGGRGDATSAGPASCGDGIIQRTLPDGGGEVCDPGPDAGMPSTASSCSADCTTILCPDGGHVGPTNDHCYFTLDLGNVSMDRATAGCAAQGAHVVTFDDADEENAVDGFFGVDGGVYWMALTEGATQMNPIYDVTSTSDVSRINEPGWRFTCSGCYGPTLGTRSQSSFLNFCKGFLVAAPCVAHNPTTPAFIGVNCSGSCEADASAADDTDAGIGVHALCEREPAGLTGTSCDDGGVCITLKATSSMYELAMEPSSAALTWQQAESTCAAKSGHLVVFETAEERAQLSHELSARLQPGAPELEYWVGLQNVGNSATGWTWVTGEPESAFASEWADGEPSPTTGPVAYATVEVLAESTLFDRQLLHAATNVTDTRPYVCEFPAP